VRRLPASPAAPALASTARGPQSFLIWANFLFWDLHNRLATYGTVVAASTPSIPAPTAESPPAFGRPLFARTAQKVPENGGDASGAQEPRQEFPFQGNDLVQFGVH
jgi:hypothetical protein